MNRRLLLAVCALAFLGVLSGCLGIGTGPVPAEEIDNEPAESYEWTNDRSTHITIQENTKFRTVITLNESSIQLFRNDGFGGTNPLSVSAVRYRYPGGEIITGTELRERGGEIRQTQSETIITLPTDAPDQAGKIAFTSGGSRKRFSLPTYVDGSYEIILPPNRRIEIPVFGTASPGGYETEIDSEDQLHLQWTDIDKSTEVVSARFYLQRDLYIFGGVAAFVLLVGLGGLLRYRQQIQRLRAQRTEMGLEVEADDDDEFDDGPPPGMG